MTSSAFNGPLARLRGQLQLPPLPDASKESNEFSIKATFRSLVKKWEEQKNTTNYDPTDFLNEMADILEKEHDVYLSKYPDPFEEQHPSITDPEGAFGQCLDVFFKHGALVEELFAHYLRDNYFTRLGQSKSSFDLNVAACRMVIDILPGLEKGVFQSTDGLVKRLYAWVKDENVADPLKSYATGLLGEAMELQEVADDAENRVTNTSLIPILIKRLRDLQQYEYESELREGTSFNNCNYSAQSLISSSSEGYNCGLRSPTECTRFNAAAESSNSSWVEMESHMIGHFPIHPISLQAKQIFILRLLTPLGEYQEFHTHIVEQRIQDLLIKYINIRKTKDSRLSFEALRFCAALFCHKKFLLEWVGRNCCGVQLFLEVPKLSICSTAVAKCLCYLAHDDETMEKVCLLPTSLLQKLIKYILWLVECSHDSGRQWAVMFCGSAFAFRRLLDIIDEQEGVRKLYNSINTLQILNPDSGPGTDYQLQTALLTDHQKYNQRLHVRHVMSTLRLYVQAHLAIRATQLRRLQGRGESTEISIGTMEKTSSGFGVNDRLAIAGSMHQVNGILSTAPWIAVPEHKPAKFTPAQISDQVETLMQLMPFRSRWQPIDNFIQLGGVTTCLKVIAIAYDWTFQGRAEMVRSALDILSIAAIMPKVQLQFCEKIDLPDETKPVGINIILGAAEGEIVQDSADVWRSALQVIINCVCAPIDRKGGTEITHIPSIGTPRKSKSHIRTSEDLINKIWDCVRQNNGIMTLLNLLHIKRPITDADSVRALACRSLVGLARSDPAKQIMSKLPIFVNYQLVQLIREPILQDKRIEHVKFQSYALDLFTMVASARGGRIVYQDLLEKMNGMESLHKASVVAQTKIQFSKTQLLQLVHKYLISQEMHESANAIAREMGDFHMLPVDPKNKRISLPSIVSDYLSSQHKLCKNPMATCPDFDLFTPHKCPDPKTKNSPPMNIVTRLSARASGYPPFGGCQGGNLNRNLIYSRFRPVKTFKTDTERENTFTSCAMMPTNDYLLAGTYVGDVKLFDINSTEEVSTYHCHDSQVNHIQSNRNGSLILTSSQWRTPYSCLWSMGEFFDCKIRFPDDDYVEFSNLTQDKIIATHDSIASIWDIEHGKMIRTLKPQIGNNYQKNQATFDPSDDLVLNDGVLFDMRMGKEIRKLDKFNQNLNGVFHPNGLEIISNTEVWDIRYLCLLKSVPGLDQCNVKFSNSGDIIYAVATEQETDEGEKYGSTFKTFDALTYSSIATFETKREVFDLATSINDLQIAVVENTLAPQITEKSVVRLYDVGRYRAEEEDLEDGDDEDPDSEGEDEEDILDDLGLGDDTISGSGAEEEEMEENDEEAEDEEVEDEEADDEEDISDDLDRDNESSLESGSNEVDIDEN